MSRSIAVLAMTGALLAATPLAASATAPPAAGVEPTALCSAAPPPSGYQLMGSYDTCGECQLMAQRWESIGRGAYCQEAFTRLWLLYVAPA